MEKLQIKISKIAVGILFTAFFLFSCNSNSSMVDRRDTTIADLISHYKQNGYHGEFSVKLFSLIGADGGGSYKGSNFDFEIYQFNEKSKAKNISLYEHSYAKGYFAIKVHSGDEKMIKEIFYNF